MSVCAAILCAGRGERFGGDKLLLPLGGKPVWRWSFDLLRSHPLVDRLGLVVPEDQVDAYGSAAPEATFVVAGGETRSASVRAALGASKGADLLLLHDGARPFVTAALVSRLVEAASRSGGAVPSLTPTDTTFLREDGRTEPLDRSKLAAVQTPQIARWEWLAQAHEGGSTATDDATLLLGAGHPVEFVPGDPENFKITTVEDYTRALGRLAPTETRTGIGYDIHAFDPAETGLVLGGVVFPDARKLMGHSDADVLCHAIADAVLGAVAAGDIGVHFPNTDPQWRGAASTVFLDHVARLISDAGWRILNVDATLIAEHPRVMDRVAEMRATIAKALATEPSRVGVKATTNERLGSLGRGEGIAAFAVATLGRF